MGSYHDYPKLKLKSTYIEDSDTTQSTPNYAIHSRQRDKYIWRDIFDIGVSDENGNKILHNKNAPKPKPKQLTPEEKLKLV